MGNRRGAEYTERRSDVGTTFNKPPRPNFLRDPRWVENHPFMFLFVIFALFVCSLYG